ncbi:hypothetical protein A6R68_11147 [Neotoma lepida]|uniref:DUF1899 domain-containing protein n=1 Tax=Neotoma lepida TaxID=56216 RepID=A0A1A6FX31_NEOLE|nr:hypothetical protein A6R68_11147 [Neotoma lepida]
MVEGQQTILSIDFVPASTLVGAAAAAGAAVVVAATGAAATNSDGSAKKALTFSAIFISCTSLRISMMPLEILVVTPKAWKKEVFSGPRPVFWAGTVTSYGSVAPARAAAGTLLASSMSLISVPRMALRIMVFLPISTTAFPRRHMRICCICVETAFPRRDMRICCICVEPTLSAPTMKHFGRANSGKCKNDWCYEDIQMSHVTRHNTFCTANPKFQAVTI